MHLIKFVHLFKLNCLCSHAMNKKHLNWKLYATPKCCAYCLISHEFYHKTNGKGARRRQTGPEDRHFTIENLSTWKRVWSKYSWTLSRFQNGRPFWTLHPKYITKQFFFIYLTRWFSLSRSLPHACCLPHSLQRYRITLITCIVGCWKSLLICFYSAIYLNDIIRYVSKWRHAHQLI